MFDGHQIVWAPQLWAITRPATGICLGMEQLYTRAKSPEIQAFIQKAIDCKDSASCLVWPYNKRPDGYAVIRRKGSKHTKDRVHVLVCTAVHGPRPTAAHEVAHSCNVRACINPRHLRWATSKENHSDCYVHDTINRGERNGAAKLTLEDVREICDRRAEGHRTLGREFGVNRATIQKIRKGQRWAWVSDLCL